jgi:sec-independent protein translocase protein TatA
MTGLVSPGHLVILLIVLLLVFGTKRLPELGRSLGSGMREFKDSVTTDKPEIGAGSTDLAHLDRPPVAGAQPEVAPPPVEAVAAEPAPVRPVDRTAAQ